MKTCTMKACKMKACKIAARTGIAVTAIAVALSAVFATIGIPLAAAPNKDSQPVIHIHNLYADQNGDTHFRDIQIEPESVGPGGGKVSARFPATGIIFSKPPRAVTATTGTRRRGSSTSSISMRR